MSEAAGWQDRAPEVRYPFGDLDADGTLTVDETRVSLLVLIDKDGLTYVRRDDDLPIRSMIGALKDLALQLEVEADWDDMNGAGE